MPTTTELPTLYSQFIHLSRYSRWILEQNRRETWSETVKRYFDFFEKHLSENHNFTLTKSLREELEGAVLKLEVMPSMRCLMTAGNALERDNVSNFNCAFAAIDTPKIFDEMMYILMCFHPEVMVKTKSGNKKISEIVPNVDEVLSFNTENEQFEYIKPSHIFENDTTETEKIELEFEDGTSVLCTSNHLFLTEERGWIEAKFLNNDDNIITYGEDSFY